MSHITASLDEIVSEQRETGKADCGHTASRERFNIVKDASVREAWTICASCVQQHDGTVYHYEPATASLEVQRRNVKGSDRL